MPITAGSAQAGAAEKCGERRSILGNRRTVVTFLAVIALAGMALRFYRLSARSMWFDESSSWRTSQLPLPEMIASIARNNHVPLHYVLLKLCVKAFGESLWVMRGLSVVLSGVAMIGVYLFASEAYRSVGPPDANSSLHTGRWIGLVSAALVAVSLLQIRAAWDARMYTLGTALTALSSWTLFRALSGSGGSRQRWIVHGLVTLLLAYTHHFALFSIAGQVLFLACYFAGRMRSWPDPWYHNPILRGAVLAYAIVAIGWGLWIPIFLRQIAQVQQQYWTGPLRLSDAMNLSYQMFLDGPVSGVSALAAAAACGSLILALAWKGNAADRYVVTLAVMPVGLGMAASLVGRNIFVLRSMVFAHLFVLVGIAAILAKIKNARIRNAIAAWLVFMGATVYVGYWMGLNVLNKPGMRAATAYIEANRKPNEQVIVSSPLLYFPALYHLRDRSACYVYSGGAPFLHHQGGPFTKQADLISGEQISAIGPGRVWVVSGGWDHVRIPFPANWQGAQREVYREVFGFQGVVVVTRFDVIAGQSK